MLLYICPVDYELNIKEKLGYLDPVTGKLYLSYQSDETLLKVVYPEYDEKMIIICLKRVLNVKGYAIEKTDRFCY